MSSNIKEKDFHEIARDIIHMIASEVINDKDLINYISQKFKLVYVTGSNDGLKTALSIQHEVNEKV